MSSGIVLKRLQPFGAVLTKIHRFQCLHDKLNVSERHMLNIWGRRNILKQIKQVRAFTTQNNNLRRLQTDTVSVKVSVEDSLCNVSKFVGMDTEFPCVSRT